MLEAAEDKYEIEYEIDRSAVPNLPLNDITLNVAVGEANAISAVDENGEDLLTLYNEKTGVVSITTAGDLIKLSFFTETAGNPLIGSYVPATLKNDFQWAWSHGIDDNENLEGSIRQLQERDWTGTLFLIGELIEEATTNPDFITATRAQELLAEGWSIGNHSYDYLDCEARPGTYEQNILDGQQVLDELVATSETPEHIILSFAAPCFLNGFHPAMLSLRDSGTVSLRINESGDNSPVLLDSGSFDQQIEGRQIATFDFDSPLGRKGTIDQGTLQDTIRDVDWVARNSNETQHLWYNSLSHGEREDNEGVESRLGGLVEYIYRNYGPIGTNEVWVAPSDHIISYIIIRDLAKFDVVSVSRNSELLDKTIIRQVEPNSAGNLESSGFLPTRIRPVDTPIPIVVEIAKASTLVPTVPPTIASAAISTPTPDPASSEPTLVAELPESDSGGNNLGDPPASDSQTSSADDMANIAVWSVMVVAALISLTLFVLLTIFALRFWRTRNRRS